jgi:glycerol kinase
MTKPKYVVAIDQGTTSSRAILFDLEGRPAFVSQKEFTQIYPKPGWTQHNPMEILESVETTLSEAMAKAGATAADIAAVGITNQRETTVAWDRETGKPLHDALVWLDLRTADIAERLKQKGGQDRFRAVTGLPVSTYFSAVKMMWLMENSSEVAKAVERGTCCFGTIDSWLTFCLTGGADGGRFVTDCSNASRYMLMDLAKLRWDAGICEELGIPIACLPDIRSNSEELGRIKSGPLAGVSIAGSLGDQHSALLGQACLDIGDVKSTYGTGCFILMNTGGKAMPSNNGLLTTYALEGAVATAGRGIQWLRDGLKLIEAAPEIGPLAASVPDAGGVTFVPAFSGLLAPHWRPDARAALVGMSLYSTKAHICRAMLEGICFQACDVMGAMEMDATAELATLKVDGGMTMSDQAMQIQADLLGKPLLRAKMPEATALGAAFAAGLTANVWREPADIRALLDRAGGAARFEPRTTAAQREAAHARWQDAVQRSLNLDVAATEQTKRSGGGAAAPFAPALSARMSLRTAAAKSMGRLLRTLH